LAHTRSRAPSRPALWLHRCRRPLAAAIDSLAAKGRSADERVFAVSTRTSGCSQGRSR